MCVCVYVKGLLVFADLLTGSVMLVGVYHCIHLGRTRSPQRMGLAQLGDERPPAYVCQRVFGRVHVCVLMFINA